MAINLSALNKPYIIAEIGVNHNGNLERAKKLVYQAKKCGASAVKFQTFQAKTLSTFQTPKAIYQDARDQSPTHYQMLAGLELSQENHRLLFDYCQELEIDFISTPYTAFDAEFLNTLGVEIFKTASADLVDIPLHVKISSFKKPTLVSTGMGSLGEISQILDIYRTANCPVYLMHCISEYPTPNEHLSMKRINALQRMGSGQCGFSDHSSEHIGAVIAIAMGVQIFEKHITLSRLDVGPDHFASLQPEEFSKYVRTIYSAYSAMGSENFFRTALEENMARTSRKSLHLKKALAKGKALSENDLHLLRPGDGLTWNQRTELEGKIATRNLEEGYKLSLEDFE